MINQIDPSRIDWNNLSDSDLATIQAFITENLTQREIAEIDFRTTGNILLAWSKSISVETNKMLSIIAEWVDDPHFMDKYRITDSEGYDWAQYKQQQRQFTVDQRQAIAERMKMYHEAIHRKQQLRDELSSIIPPRTEAQRIEYDHYQDSDPDRFISGSSELMGAFSQVEQNKADLAFEFQQLLNKHLADIIPWKAIIMSELQAMQGNISNGIEPGKMAFDDFAIYTEYHRAERAARFTHLLQMETDQLLTLHQDKHLAPITIIPKFNQHAPQQSVTVTDKAGKESHINVLMLSRSERMSLVSQAAMAEVIIR